MTHSRRHSRATSQWIGWLIASLILHPGGGPAQVVLPQSVLRGENEQLLQMKFSDAPLQVVLDHYAEITGRTLITSPGVPAVLISLRSKEKLTETEFLTAIESVLHMNQVSLVPLGEKFLKVVPSAELGTNAEEISVGLPEPGAAETDKMERRIVTLKYLTYEELQPIIDQVKHAYGKVTPLERANSFMIIDTASNLKRLTEIIEFLDRPIEAKAETRIYELQHAQAADVAGRLNELVQTSQQDRQPQAATRRSAQQATTGTRGVIRAGAGALRQAVASQPDLQSAADLAERGIIVGEVKIVADERTNIIIVISEPANFAFFDKIVTILDRAIEPELTVEVVSLEYADAEEISGILNDFVGAATADQQSQRRSEAGAAAAADAGADARAQALRSFIQQRQAAARRTTTPEVSDQLAAGIAQLSENTRILADQRTNSLLLMGRRADIEILQRVIDQLDVMLAQVLIEAVIVEVQLDDNLSYGIEWLQRSYTAFSEDRIGPGNSVSVREPVFAFGGASDLDGTGPPFLDGSEISRATPFTPGALTYFATFYDLNIDAILQLAAGTSDAKILSTPVIVTTDNTEANIIVGESRPVVTSTSVTAGGVGRNTFQYQDIGIELTVTPRINPQRFVVMEITQTADNVGGFEVIDGNNVPVITRRELTASIAVENRSSIVLGGLIGSEKRKARTKVAFLGDLPILGTLFRTEDLDTNRTELLVIITPYVMTTPNEVLAETMRLNERSLAHREWGKTWSDSPVWRMQAEVEEEAPAPLLDRYVEEIREEQARLPEPLVDAAPMEAEPDRTPDRPSMLILEEDAAAPPTRFMRPVPDPAPPAPSESLSPPLAPSPSPPEPEPGLGPEPNDLEDAVPPPLSRLAPALPPQFAPAAFAGRPNPPWEPATLAGMEYAFAGSPDAPPIHPEIETTSIGGRPRPAMGRRRSRPEPETPAPNWKPVPRPLDVAPPSISEVPQETDREPPTAPPPVEPPAKPASEAVTLPAIVSPRQPEAAAPVSQPPTAPVRIPATPSPPPVSSPVPEESPRFERPIPVVRPPATVPDPRAAAAPPPRSQPTTTPTADPRRRIEESIIRPPSPAAPIAVRRPAAATPSPAPVPTPPPISLPVAPEPAPPPSMAPTEDAGRESASQRIMDELRAIVGAPAPPLESAPAPDPSISSQPAPSRTIPSETPLGSPAPAPRRLTSPRSGVGILPPVRPDPTPRGEDTEARPPLQ